MRVEDLDTPVVLIDIDIVDRNLARMSSYCREHGLNLRPHIKTHKIPKLAKLQIESGACGVTAAKVSEARVMVENGIDDVMLAYPIVSPEKAQAVAELAEQARITVALDSLESAQILFGCLSDRGARIGVLVEIDVGLRRCGVGDPDVALELARCVGDLPGLDFRGLMFFPGHLLAPRERQSVLLGEVNHVLDRYFARFDAANVPIAVVSGGSTPTAYRGHEFHGVTEIRPGMYIFNDRNMVGVGVADWADCAVTVVTTVVSTAVRGRAIVDAGSKTLSSDRFLAGDGQGYGHVVGDPQTCLEFLSEEHGHLDVSRSDSKYRVGDRIAVVPNHVCPTMNMHDEVCAVRQGLVEEVWEVSARGKVK